MNLEELNTWQAFQEHSAHAEMQVQLRLAGLQIASGLLLVAEAVFANLSNQVSLQQTLLRGYLLLLVPVLGFLLAALALAGLIGVWLGQRAARRDWERLPAEVRPRLPALPPSGTARLLVNLAAWGTCILWLLVWVVVYALTSVLI
jgi:hypothetical protein